MNAALLPERYEESTIEAPEDEAEAAGAVLLDR